MADRDHDASLLVADAAPVRRHAGRARLIGYAGFEKLGAGNLKAVLEIVNRMEDGVVVGNVFDGAIRENLGHARKKHLPLTEDVMIRLVAVKIVDHEETA